MWAMVSEKSSGWVRSRGERQAGHRGGGAAASEEKKQSRHRMGMMAEYRGEGSEGGRGAVSLRYKM